MKRFGAASVMLVAFSIVAIALPAAATALEKPENLPALKAGETRTATSTSSGSIELRGSGGEVITCPKAKGEVTETKSVGPEGSSHITFEECTTKIGGSSVACTGLGDSSGIILALGTWQLVFDRKKGGTFTELTTAHLLKIEAIHFACSIILIEFLAGGEVLCLHLKPTEESLTHESTCLGPATGVEQQGEYSLKDVEPVWKTPVMLASTNHNTAIPWIWILIWILRWLIRMFAMQ